MSHLAEFMHFLGFTSFKVDLDMLLKPEVRSGNAHKYYSYILLLIDDVLCIHHKAVDIIKHIDKYFHMKPESIGDLPRYILGPN